MNEKGLEPFIQLCSCIKNKYVVGEKIYEDSYGTTKFNHIVRSTSALVRPVRRPANCSHVL